MPDANLANNPVVAATKSSVVTIRALAPSCQKELEGSGFVVSDHTVMSNAHVVAGSNSVTVQDTDGNSYDATVVSYDPAVDIAILDVPGLPAPPLAFANAPAATGTDALVMGFPDAGSFEATPARIREVVELDGPDIYRTMTVTRQVYTISGTVRQGDSGGPLLDLNGQVLGVVFGEAVDHPDTGFVMTAEQVSRELQNIGNTTAVATMHRSRLNTRMVYFHGIFLTNESTRNSELSNSLSAMGSRYCPSMVCWCKALASNPSRASLRAAATRRPSAQTHCPSNTVMMTKGMKIRRRRVIWFGAVQN